MRRIVGFVGVALLTALTACTSGTPEDSGGKSDDSGEEKTEPVEFGSKPVWTIGAGPDDDQSKQSGLKEVSDIQLVGDHVVLLGWDKDGDLNDQFQDHDQNRAAIVVLDAETGKRVWWISEQDPFAEDKSMIVTGLRFDDSSKVNITESGSIVVGYAKETKEADVHEIGVAALAIDSGKLLSSAVALKHDTTGNDVNIVDGVVGDHVLVNVDVADESGDDERVRAMVLNVDTGEKVWSRDDMHAAAMTEDVLLLTTPEEDSEDMSYHTVDRDSDKTLWKADAPRKKGVYNGVYSFTSAVTVVNNDDESVIIDTATGKKLDTFDTPVSGCVNSTSLIACQVGIQGLVSISIDGKATRFSKVRPITNAAVTAVSNWIFTSRKGEKRGTYTAIDAAGNKIDTPGMVADLDKKLAITYTTSDEGLRATVSEISAYKIGG